MEIALVTATGLLCVICFLVGAKVGQTVSKGEDISVPTVNPIEVYKAKEAKKHAEMEQNRIDTIMRNIEAFDGTPNGQEDVPGVR